MTYLDLMIRKYEARGLLLDSNLLLLHLVGSVSTTLIGQKTLGGFDFDQFLTLEELISRFRRVVTTAHVLTEVSNLINAFNPAVKVEIWANFVQHLEVFEEQPLQSYVIARRPECRFLGLTDTALGSLAEQFLVVTKDGRMVNHLRDHMGANALKWVEVLGI